MNLVTNDDSSEGLVVKVSPVQHVGIEFRTQTVRTNRVHGLTVGLKSNQST
jgi:hypothetical protein